MKTQAAESLFKSRNFNHLLGKLELSDALLKDHFKLYEGYVKKLNEITQGLAEADRSAPNYSFNAYSELKRREAVPYNGVVLHELYFENLAEAGKTSPSKKMKEALTDGYGSFDDWVADMKAAALSSHGWALTVYDPFEKKLKTDLVSSEHHVGLFANCRIIIALDAWEHAYIAQFGIKKEAYITAFFENMNWDAAEKTPGCG